MKDYPLGTCVTRSRSIKSCRGLAQCSYYRHMSAADHATVRSVHTVHSTPHDLMCLHWHCPVACGDIRQCRTCCCRGQDNNGWLLLSCHLLSANALYRDLFNLQFTQQHQHRITSHQLRRTSVCWTCISLTSLHCSHHHGHVSCHVQCGHHG